MTTPEARAAYLQAACSHDVTLRRKVDELLKEHFSDDSLLAGPALDELRPVTVESPLPESVPQMVGRYKLLEKIGEGGFGEVWMAEQREPVKRRVALKIIKLGMDSRQVVARFEAERQALAMMDHANIAKIFDAGTTDTGRPYFVMELVRGIKITEYCDQNQFPTLERLRLFILVCRAVQHAHQKGVIHRDLKPSNILVTLHDGVPVPKVIDFGIAKATQQELTDKTVFTQFQQFIGTPAYISPEQAEMSGLDIDTRADIYSLGVLLYELLVGQTPFDAKEMMRGGLDALRQIIREKEPLRPSTKLNTLESDARTTAGKVRQTDVGRLVHQLQGDLDWIVMKCLEKDRQRRYETANGLAADIQRHLANEPVVARPPSRLYEFQKTARRHKVGFAAAGAVILALAVGLGISTWTLVNEKRARGRAVVAEKAAEHNATQAELETKRAEKNAAEAQAQRKQAEALVEENRRNLYAARVKLAAQAIAEGDVPYAQELLDGLLPGKGEEDLRSFDWHYLHQLASNEKLALTGVGGRVRSVTFSPDGRLLAAASSDGNVRLWDIATQARRGVLKGHTGAARAVAFAPNGETLASAGADGTVRIWNVADGRELQRLQAGTNALLVMASSPDGTRLAVGEGAIPSYGENAFTRYAKCSGQGRIQVWNTRTHQLERILDTKSHDALAMAFSSDGRQLVAGGVHNTLTLFDVGTGQPLLTRSNLSGPVFATLFLPNQELAAASWDPYQESGRIIIFDAATLEQKRVMLAAGKLTCLALSPDGKMLAAAGPDRVLRLRDVATGQESGVFHGHTAEIWSVAFSPDGRTVATGGLDDAIRIWDSEDHPARQRIPLSQAFSVAFSPDGNVLACGGSWIQLRETTTGALLRSLTNYVSGDMRVTFSPDGAILAATGSDQEVHFWETRTWNHWMPRKEDMATPPDFAYFAPDSQFAFSPDSKTLAMGGSDGLIRLWDARSAALIDQIKKPAYSVCYSADGTRLINGDGSELRVWNTLTQRIENRLPASGALLRISQDGRWLASGGSSRLSIRKLPGLAEVRNLRPSRDELYCVSFSHDGKILATASWDGTVKLWQVATGQELFTIPSFSGVIWSVAFSPDDRTLAFAAKGEINILRCAASEANQLKRAERLAELGTKHWMAGNPGTAELLFREALQVRRKLLPRNHPTLPDTIFNLARLLATQGELVEAEALLCELIERKPAEHYYYYFLTAVLIQKGELEHYRQHCARIVEQFASATDPNTAERMAKCCLIHASSGVDLDAVGKMADTALAVGEANPDQPWFQLAKGLAAFRQGNFTNTVECVKRALRRGGKPEPAASAYLVLAMAEHKLRHPEAARAALGKATEIVETLPRPESGELRNNWLDCVFTHALLGEARALFEEK